MKKSKKKREPVVYPRDPVIILKELWKENGDNWLTAKAQEIARAALVLNKNIEPEPPNKNKL